MTRHLRMAGFFVPMRSLFPAAGTRNGGWPFPLQTSEKENDMADRKKSTDMRRETEEVLGKQGSVSQGGRAGGRLARDIGSKDERKRAEERPAGATRVTKSDEEKED